jgi:hypothetical protein
MAGHAPGHLLLWIRISNNMAVIASVAKQSICELAEAWIASSLRSSQ